MYYRLIVFVNSVRYNVLKSWITLTVYLAYDIATKIRNNY